jgi:branched-chain amino acid transport system ATP-binding protein
MEQMAAAAAPTLTITDLARSFGALRALDGITLAVARGERRVLIGPNGAGKTTLFNVITGLLSADSGQISMLGHDITPLPAHRRAALGLARTFQITALFQNLTLQRNLLLALQGCRPTKFSMLRLMSAYQPLLHEADALLDQWAMSDRRDVLVKELSYGDQRQVEILLAIAQRPQVLLLDEPTAGLSPVETARVVEVIHGLPRELSVLVIEHDMDVAFQLADSISVLHMGQVIVTGDHQAIQTDARVREIYLGALAEKLSHS